MHDFHGSTRRLLTASEAAVPDYDSSKTTPPPDAAAGLGSGGQRTGPDREARTKLDNANVLSDEMRDRLFGLEEDIETMIQDLRP
jgi:hypothetical protein